MTTIAYNHKDKQIAVDSQSTMGSMISSLNETKWIERDGFIFFIAGKACDDEMLIDYCLGDEKKHNGMLPEASCFMVDTNNGQAWHCIVSDESILHRFKLAYDMAMGSGELFALAAMDFGKSAGDAVEYAKTRCIYTGGNVHVYDIASKEFI
jgi:ATP-dependent protease HslVU (ClpYQ) peptidase subunit